MQAQNLKDKTDMILRDYEKTRSDLIVARERNEELFREVDHLRAQNKDLDNRVVELARDNEFSRQNFSDKQALDQRELMSLASQIREQREESQELQRRNFEL